MKNKLIALSFLAIIFAFVFSIESSTPALGSVTQGSEYIATTTNSIGAASQLQIGVGTFGSLVITGAGAGVVTVYDSASSTNFATSSVLASFPASTAANTYTFDVRFIRGLAVTVTGVAPTSTITWR